MVHRDPIAGELLAELREKRGISPEAMPREMLRAGIKRDRVPSSATIRRAEGIGMVPNVSHRAGLAEFFERDMHTIWEPPSRRVAA